MLRKRSSCHPLPLELAPPIILLFYFSRAPSKPWWAAVANSNIGRMVEGQKTVPLPTRRRHGVMNLKGFRYLLLVVQLYAHHVFGNGYLIRDSLFIGCLMIEMPNKTPN
jgi:hypothetical protein